MSNEEINTPQISRISEIGRGALQITGGAIPFAGGILSAISGAWSEKDQDRVNRFFQHWIRMIKDELIEKEKTIIDIMARLDLQDEKVNKRIESEEYQSLMRKTFRDWAGAESQEKRDIIRNILANAASTDMTSDDVIRLFLDWIRVYSELHFKVIAAIYNSNGITRAGIWKKIGKELCREDSADADLYKLLIRDMSTGGIIRQHRETDYKGNFVKKDNPVRKGSTSSNMKSAFDDEEKYELTQLGQQFVHYAMTDLPPKITFQEPQSKEPT